MNIDTATKKYIDDNKVLIVEGKMKEICEFLDYLSQVEENNNPWKLCLILTQYPTVVEYKQLFSNSIKKYYKTWYKWRTKQENRKFLLDMVNLVVKIVHEEEKYGYRNPQILFTKNSLIVKNLQDYDFTDCYQPDKIIIERTFVTDSKLHELLVSRLVKIEWLGISNINTVSMLKDEEKWTLSSVPGIIMDNNSDVFVMQYSKFYYKDTHIGKVYCSHNFISNLFPDHEDYLLISRADDYYCGIDDPNFIAHKQKVSDPAYFTNRL